MIKRYFKMPIKIQFKQIVTSKFVNIFVFNLLWVGLVLGRETFIYLTLPSLLIYLTCLFRFGHLKAHQILLPALIGITIDSSLTFFGIFIFPDSSLIIPFWLIVLWINFSTTLNLSLSFIGNNKLLAFGLGATALPFNYSVGERLGAVTFAEPYLFSILVLVIVWSVGFPILFIVSHESFIKKLHSR
ncbi:MAG: hypothetical protein CML94_02255 [Rhodobiaceae bacterium]|nr:hypothetical protein [Rhodobiaceae bacterium]|tara:strand:- start:1136 stop:1696 length:561 start_codon:yes stop_codon:yes gene_type:complete